MTKLFRSFLLLALTTFAIADTVCIVGAGTIGSSFAAVYLAQGKDVVICDDFVEADAVKQRINDAWEILCARRIARTGRPALEKLRFENNLQTALQDVDYVQECVFEDIDVKQTILKQIDEILPAGILVGSSTSFIPLNILQAQCKNKDRVLITHPSIPHWGSFMELCGSNQEIVQQAKAWYTNAGFDCIVLKKTLPGHVWNSFLANTIGHGEHLVKSGFCSPEDVNTCLRHFGRELYGRNMFLSLKTYIGGDRGVDGGLELTDRIGRNAIAIVLASKLPIPGSRVLGRLLSGILKPLLVPGPNKELLDAYRAMETRIMGNHENFQKACFETSKVMYDRIPLEVGCDPLAFKS